ncbi:MAG: dihydrofolate reductase family protein, partial [Chloroflexi bacterium]|nr:dihydrofolate reductase family protein [Chloroflexota bacterium]
MCIGSGTLVTSLIHGALVDEYKFLVQPVIVASGRRLFSSGESAKMQLISSEQP